jgi:hypothetical protein
MDTDENKVNRADADTAGVGQIIETAKEQGYLLETGQTARRASVDALRAKRQPLILEITSWAQGRGRYGGTRDEASLELKRPLQSVCRPIRDLLQDGELVDTKTRRQTQWGREATVFVHRSFADEAVIARLPEGGLTNA